MGLLGDIFNTVNELIDDPYGLKSQSEERNNASEMGLICYDSFFENNILKNEENNPLISIFESAFNSVDKECCFVSMLETTPEDRLKTSNLIYICCSNASLLSDGEFSSWITLSGSELVNKKIYFIIANMEIDEIEPLELLLKPWTELLEALLVTIGDVITLDIKEGMSRAEMNNAFQNFFDECKRITDFTSSCKDKIFEQSDYLLQLPKHYCDIPENNKTPYFAISDTTDLDVLMKLLQKWNEIFSRDYNVSEVYKNYKQTNWFSDITYKWDFDGEDEPDEDSYDEIDNYDDVIFEPQDCEETSDVLYKFENFSLIHRKRILKEVHTAERFEYISDKGQTLIFECYPLQHKFLSYEKIVNGYSETIEFHPFGNRVLLSLNNKLQPDAVLYYVDSKISWLGELLETGFLKSKFTDFSSNYNQFIAKLRSVELSNVDAEQKKKLENQRKKQEKKNKQILDSLDDF